ncbi:hypothetical protein [Rhodoferax sp.]|uniref:hypothetical protein n=1 Tax=Rhodoferax sp. TaxID=50421 RepID=UPI0037846C13
MDAPIFRPISMISIGILAAMLGAAGAAVVAIAISFLIAFCLDYGNTYEAGETNFGLGMLMFSAAAFVFLILAPVFACRFFRLLNKRFGPAVNQS